MYAIIATGGKQYKVEEGDVIKVEKLGVDAGQTVTYRQRLQVQWQCPIRFGGISWPLGNIANKPSDIHSRNLRPYTNRQVRGILVLQLYWRGNCRPLHGSANTFRRHKTCGDCIKVDTHGKSRNPHAFVRTSLHIVGVRLWHTERQLLQNVHPKPKQSTRIWPQIFIQLTDRSYLNTVRYIQYQPFTRGLFQFRKDILTN